MSDGVADASTEPATELDSGPLDGGDPEACGAPPFVTLGLVVRELASGSKGAPIEGAALSASLCPGVKRVSGADGVITARVSKGVPFYARLDGTGFVPTLIAEVRFDADRLDINAPLPRTLVGALVPGFGPDTSAIVIGLTKDGGSGACDMLDGVRFEVVDHPEAKVTYLADDPIPQATTGTVTTAGGRAVITELAWGLMVSLRGAKDGCTVTFVKDQYTGRAPLEKGALTLAPAYIR